MRYITSLTMLSAALSCASAQAQTISTGSSAPTISGPVLISTGSVVPPPFTGASFVGDIERMRSEQVSQSLSGGDSAAALSQLSPAAGPAPQLAPEEYTNRLLSEKGLQ